MSRDAPPRRPQACGALGRYDRRLVSSIARGLDAPMREAHADGASILMLDRAPIEWRAGDARGLCWSESAPVTPSGAATIGAWSGAAQELNACGLALQGPRRLLHSSVAGVAPLYWLRHDRALYFASRIDPLVGAVPIDLEVDWRAWSAILTLRFPLGVRTPFRRVRRLPPFATLELDANEPRVVSPPWPWSELQPEHGVEDGLAGVIDAIRATVARMAARQLSFPLSGGWDSRVLLLALRDAGAASVEAFTVEGDDGSDREQRCAGAVAKALALPHRLLRGDADTYWTDVRERALLCDYQRVGRVTLMPLAEPGLLSGEAVPDGLGLDVLAQPGGRNISEPMLAPDGGRAVGKALWARLRSRTVARAVGRGFAPELGRAMAASARRQFMRASSQVRGHPAEALLTLYLTRTVRGISLMPQSVLGARLPTVTPFTDHRVAAACLAIEPRAKFGGHLYRAIFDALGREIGSLPSTNDQGIGRDGLPQRHRTAAAARHHELALRDGPLWPHLAPRLREAVATGTLDRLLSGPGYEGAVAGVTLFHLWHQRYRGRLRPVDPAAALSLAAPAEDLRVEPTAAAPGTG